MYGIDRRAALKLKYWEFRLLIDAFYRQQARESLNLYQMTGAAFGGEKKAVEKMLRNLRKQAGYEKPQPTQEEGKPWGGVFAGLQVMSAEEFQSFKAG